MVLYTFSIFGHFIMTFSGYYVGFNLGRSLSGGYMMRLAGMGIVDPVYTTISQRCFHIFYYENNIFISISFSACIMDVSIISIGDVEYGFMEISQFHGIIYFCGVQ